MIPLELLTMGASALVGGVLKSLDRKADRDDRLLDKVREDHQSNRAVTNPHYQWTRRTIALTVTYSVMVLPKLAALAGYPVVYGSLEHSSYLWGLFSSGSELALYTVAGVPIFPFDTHTMAAIVGLYFGGRK